MIYYWIVIMKKYTVLIEIYLIRFIFALTINGVHLSQDTSLNQNEKRNLRRRIREWNLQYIKKRIGNKSSIKK